MRSSRAVMVLCALAILFVGASGSRAQDLSYGLTGDTGDYSFLTGSSDTQASGTYSSYAGGYSSYSGGYASSYPGGYVQGRTSSILSSLLPGAIGAAAGGLLGYRFGGVMGALVGGVGGFLVGQFVGNKFLGSSQTSCSSYPLAGAYASDIYTPYYYDYGTNTSDTSTGTSTDVTYDSSTPSDAEYEPYTLDGSTFYPAAATDDPAAPATSANSNRPHRKLTDAQKAAFRERMKAVSSNPDLAPARKAFFEALTAYQEALKGTDENLKTAARSAFDQARQAYQQKKQELLGQ